MGGITEVEKETAVDSLDRGRPDRGMACVKVIRVSSLVEGESTAVGERTRRGEIRK